MRASRILAIVAAAFGVLLAVGVATFAGPCVHDDGSVSACHAAGAALVVAGVAIALLSAARVIGRRRNPSVDLVLAVATVATAVAAVALPGTLLPTCAMPTMRCNLVMRPFALVIGIVVAIVSVASVVVARSAERR